MARIQSKMVASNADVTNLTASFDTPATEGNLLVAIAQRRGAGSMTGPSGWSEAWNYQALDFGQSGLWYKIAGASESSDVLVQNNTTAGNVIIAIAEYSGIETTAPLDKIATNDTNVEVVTLSTGTAAQSTAANALVIAEMGVRLAEAAGWSWTNSLVHVDNIFSSGTSSLTLAWAERFVTSLLAAESTASWTGAGRAGGGIAVFKLATTTLALSDVDTDETVTSDQTGVSVTGAEMGADNSARTFDLVQGAVAVPQTETGTGTATAAMLSMVTETAGTDIRFGAATLRVTRTSDSATANIGITVEPPVGQVYVDLTSIYPLAPNRITAVPDIAIGDQLQASGVGGGAVPSGLSLLADGTASFASGSTPADFDVRVYSDTDKTWGAWATQTAATLAGPTVLFAAFGA